MNCGQSESFKLFKSNFLHLETPTVSWNETNHSFQQEKKKKNQTQGTIRNYWTEMGFKLCFTLQH